MPNYSIHFWCTVQRFPKIVMYEGSWNEIWRRRWIGCCGGNADITKMSPKWRRFQKQSWNRAKFLMLKSKRWKQGWGSMRIWTASPVHLHFCLYWATEWGCRVLARRSTESNWEVDVWRGEQDWSCYEKGERQRERESERKRQRKRERAFNAKYCDVLWRKINNFLILNPMTTNSMHLCLPAYVMGTTASDVPLPSPIKLYIRYFHTACSFSKPH